jgi:hypothetical protein
MSDAQAPRGAPCLKSRQSRRHLQARGQPGGQTRTTAPPRHHLAGSHCGTCLPDETKAGQRWFAERGPAAGPRPGIKGRGQGEGVPGARNAAHTAAHTGAAAPNAFTHVHTHTRTHNAHQSSQREPCADLLQLLVHQLLHQVAGGWRTGCSTTQNTRTEDKRHTNRKEGERRTPTRRDAHTSPQWHVEIEKTEGEDVEIARGALLRPQTPKLRAKARTSSGLGRRRQGGSRCRRGRGGGSLGHVSSAHWLRRRGDHRSWGRRKAHGRRWRGQSHRGRGRGLRHWRWGWRHGHRGRRRPSGNRRGRRPDDGRWRWRCTDCEHAHNNTSAPTQ